MMCTQEWQGENYPSSDDWWPSTEEQNYSIYEQGPQTASAVEQAWFGRGSQGTSPLAAMRTSVTSLKAPPKMQQGQTWFDYEKLIRDWMVVAEVEKVKRGTLLKLSLEGTAELYKNLLDDKELVKEDGADYFLRTLRPHFVKGCIQTFLYIFLQLNGCRRGNSDFRDWLLRLQLKREEAISAWMELCPPAVTDSAQIREDIRQHFNEQFERSRTERVAHLRSVNRDLSEEDAMAEATRLVNVEMVPLFRQRIEELNQEIIDKHRERFPYDEFTFALVTLVLADMQQEKMEKFSLYLKNRDIMFTSLTFDIIREFCMDIFCSATTALTSPFYNQGRSGEKSYCVSEPGILDDLYEGYWVEDDETGV